MTALEYNLMCVSTLSYVWQFCVADASVLSVERKMLQRLAGCPRFTFTTEAMWSLDSLGMSTNFKSIKASNIAAIVRMSMRTATSFAKMRALLDQASLDDHAPLASITSRECDWFDTPAIVNTMQRAMDHAFLPDVKVLPWQSFLRDVSSRGDAGDSFQKAVLAEIQCQIHQFDAAGFLSRRMRRWHPEVSEQARTWWSFCGAFALQLARHELRGAAQCVVAAYLKTILNGWSTSRRCGVVDRTKCAFQCGSKLDCIEHYLRCKRVEQVWFGVFGTEWGPFEARLAIGSCEEASRVSRAFFLYGLMSAYNFMRYNGSSGDVEFVTNIVRCKITMAAGRSTAYMRTCLQGPRNRHTDRIEHNSDTAPISTILFTFRKRALFQKAVKRPRSPVVKRRRLR